MDISPGANRYLKKNYSSIKGNTKTNREALLHHFPEGVLTMPACTGRKEQVMFYPQHKGPHLSDS